MGVCINRYVGQHERTKPMEEESDKNQQPLKPTPSRPMNDNATPNISGLSSNYDKLCLSLLCGFPNEQELALNVCTILSNEGSYMLHLDQSPKLVDMLIAQTGIWRTDDTSLKMLYLESWKGSKGRNMYQFWRSTLDLQNERLVQLLGLDLGEYEMDFFNLESDLGLLNMEGQRVLRIASILHNLSFEKTNVPVLVASHTFLRFLLLSINSSWANLKQTAYDTLSNIAHTIKLSIEKDICSRLLFQAVTDGLQSYDRYMTIRSMDILSQLCDPNEDVIPSRLDVEIYQQIVSFLTTQDIMLLFYTLEALYALSDLGRYPCDRIACIHGSIGSLVSLLTLDPSQYGPSAQIRMKIVETLVPSEEKIESAPSDTSSPSSNVDSETFASNWLKSTYEVSPGKLTSRNDVYADYVSFCTKAGRKGVLNANVFASCVKKSFPLCGLKKVTSGMGVVTFHHDSLKRKNVVTSLGVPPVLKTNTVAPKPTLTETPPVQSPILKAQLSASATPLLKTYSQQNSVKAPVTTSTPSTLIKSLLANKVQQRNLQQSVSKMVIYPNSSPPTTLVRCIRPSLQARIISNKGCIITSPSSGVIKANPMWSPQIVKRVVPATQINGIQSEIKMEVKPEEDIFLSQMSQTNPTLENPMFGDSCDDVFHPSPIQGKPSDGNFFIVRQPSAKHGVALVNGSDITTNLSRITQPVIQPKIVSSSILKSVLNEDKTQQQIQRESICKKAPLLNGLLDKGKLPLLEEFQSKILLQNGSSKSTTPVQLNRGSSPISTSSLVSMSVSPDSFSPNSVITISTNSISQGIFTISSSNSISPLSVISPAVLPTNTSPSLNSIVIPASSLSSVILPASSLASAILPPQISTPVLMPSILPATSFHSNGTDLMQICTGQTTFSGTVEADQKGVVRLHIESPENSNQGSDLSSISDIARTLECASQAISRTNAECNTQVPYSSACVAPQTVTVINTNTPTLARTGQQIIVVTPVINQPQSPNIKLCILQSFPKTDDSLVTIPKVNLSQLRQPAPETALKRPSSDCATTAVKKPRVDSPLLEASLRSMSADAQEVLPIFTKSTPLETADSEVFPSGLNSVTDNPSPVTTKSSKLEFSCEWRDCGLKFPNPGSVFLHASRVHVPPVCDDDVVCQWEGCDSMKRRRFSLLTHLQDWHCNERVLHTQAMRSLQLSQQGKTSVPPPQKPPPHPGYAPDAAVLAIKRHALQYINPKELSEEKESALTKSIRLTSALILRNLVTHSSIARTYVRRFEAELAYLAMSPVESARTLAQCLSELTHD